MQYEPLNTGNWANWRTQILRLEAQVYEPSRQDTPETLERIICEEKGVSLAPIDSEQLAR